MSGAAARTGKLRKKTNKSRRKYVGKWDIKNIQKKSTRNNTTIGEVIYKKIEDHKYS